jgi:hypothetical protein
MALPIAGECKKLQRAEMFSAGPLRTLLGRGVVFAGAGEVARFESSACMD